jgi:hypothetical protein
VAAVHNEIVAHHDQPLNGPTGPRKFLEHTPHPEEGALRLQDHGDLVRFEHLVPRVDRV